MHKILLLSAGLLTVFAMVAPSQAQVVLKREPDMGRLREGERVLVDDGSCGPGKLKLVIGGNHIEVGGFKKIKRQYRCVPKH